MGNSQLVAEILRSRNVDVLRYDNDGRNAFYWACAGKSVAVLKLLLERANCGVNVIAHRKSRMTVLHTACKYGAVRIVKELLKHETLDLYVEDESGRNALY